MKAFETIKISKEDKTSLLSKESPSRSKKRWTTFQCLIIILLVLLATNMDRIVNLFYNTSSSSSSSPSDTGKQTNSGIQADYDIIVVGGGPSGLLQAHFLQENYPEYNILIIEGLHRVGGRSFSSVISYGTPDNTITVEHGAMRFYTSNSRTRRILNYLDLCSYIVPFDNSVLRTTSRKTFSSRNNYVLEKDINADYWLNTYNLSPNEQILVESQPFDPAQAFYKIVVDKLSIENKKEYPPTTDQGWDEFRDKWTLNGMILNKWSLPMLIRYFNYSLEFQQLVIDSYGYDNYDIFPAESQFFYQFDKLYSPDNDNNHRRMQWGSTVFTIKSGYHSIPQQLLTKFTAPDKNGQIIFNQKVIGIDKNVQDNIYNVKTSENTYSANQVILAIPAEPLQEILPNIDVLYNDADANYVINSLYGQGDICKMNLIFNDLNIPKDILPSIISSVDQSRGLGSMYVWYGDNENGVGEGSLTAIHFYNMNTASCESWYNYQLQTEESGIYQAEGVNIDNINDVILLTVDMVNALMLEFSEFMENSYNIKNINMPVIGTIAPWGQINDFGATLHRYKSGYSSSYVLSRINKPNKNENIFIGISDWSVNSGFVEGAIAASVANLEQNFNINDFLNGEQQCSLP